MRTGLRERKKLAQQEPELGARIWDHLVQEADLLCTAIAERSGLGSGDFNVRATAWILVGAMWAATERWVRGDGREELRGLYERALDIAGVGKRLEVFDGHQP